MNLGKMFGDACRAYKDNTALVFENSRISFKDLDEVIERSNKTMFGLAAAVWTRDVGKAHRVANSVRAGTIWVNCYDVFDAAAPFGGFKMSGMGRELGAAALANYTELKTVTLNLG